MVGFFAILYLFLSQKLVCFFVTLCGVVKLLFFIGAAFKRAYFAFKYLCYLSEWAIQHLLVSYKDHRTDTEKTPPKAGEFCPGQVARDSFGLL